MAFCKPRYEIFRDGKRIVTSAQAGTLIGALVTDAQKFCFPDPVTPVDPCTIVITDLDVVPTVEGYEWTISYTSTGALYQFLQVDSEAYILMDGSPFVFETDDLPGTITLWASNDFTPQSEADFCADDQIVIRESELFTDDEEEFAGTFTAVDCGAGVLTREVIYTSTGVTVTPGVGNAFTGVATDAGAGMFVILNLCDGLPHSVDVYNIEPEPVVLGLRLGFKVDIANAPVADPTSVSDWNTFFNLPTNGTPFTSVIVSGLEAKLMGGGNLIIKYAAFNNSTAIDYLIDEAGVLIEVGNNSFYGVTMSEFTANSMSEAGSYVFSDSTIAIFNATGLQNAGNKCFEGLGSTTFNAPNMVNLGASAFASSTIAGSYTFNSLLTTGNNCFNSAPNITALTMPILTALGSTVADNFVFTGMTALTAVTVPTALATADAGNPDGDLVYAVGTLGATITYV